MFSNIVVALWLDPGVLLVLMMLLQSINAWWDPLRPAEGWWTFESGAPILCRWSKKTASFFPVITTFQTTCVLSLAPCQVNDRCLVLIVHACEYSHFFDSVCREVETIVCAGWIDWNINCKVWWFDINYMWIVLNVLRTSCDTGLRVAQKTGASSKELPVQEDTLMREVTFKINNPLGMWSRTENTSETETRVRRQNKVLNTRWGKCH